MPKPMWELVTMDDEGKDVMMIASQKCHTVRTKSKEDTCLASFVAYYTTLKE